MQIHPHGEQIHSHGGLCNCVFVSKDANFAATSRTNVPMVVPTNSLDLKFGDKYLTHMLEIS